MPRPGDRGRVRRPAVRRLLTILGSLATLGLGAWWLLGAGPAKPRHVVVVVLDTVRADRIGVYGDALAITPTLDTLAREGVLFEQAIAAAPSTLVSHTSMFTGNYAHRHGVPRNDYGVSDENDMLPEVLGRAGFETAAFLGAIPLGSHSNFPQGFDTLDEAFSLHRKEDKVGQTMRPGTDVNAAVRAFLDARSDDAPLFLFVHYFDAHAPYQPSERWRAAHKLSDLPPNAGSMRHLARTRYLLRRELDGGARELSRVEALYRADISETDAALGELLADLKARGMLDDSLLIVTSDHGESMDEHEERFDHGATVYDTTVHVPLLVRFPGGAEGGRRVAAQVSGVDLFPSVLDALDLPIPEVEGQSWLPEALGELGLAARGPAFSEATKPHIVTAHTWLNDPMRKAVRWEGWKLIAEPRDKGRALYDLGADPGETTDRWKQEPGRAAALKAELERWRGDANPLPSPRLSSARVKAELAALGYTEALEGNDEQASESDTDAGADEAAEDDE